MWAPLEPAVTRFPCYSLPCRCLPGPALLGAGLFVVTRTPCMLAFEKKNVLPLPLQHMLPNYAFMCGSERFQANGSAENNPQQ